MSKCTTHFICNCQRDLLEAQAKEIKLLRKVAEAIKINHKHCKQWCVECEALKEWREVKGE